MVNNKNSEAFSEDQEAKRLKLLARSQKLEQKGQKLLAKAKAAAAKYEKLTIQKENAERKSSNPAGDSSSSASSSSSSSFSSESTSTTDGGAPIADTPARNASFKASKSKKNKGSGDVPAQDVAATTDLPLSKKEKKSAKSGKAKKDKAFSADNGVASELEPESLTKTVKAKSDHKRKRDATDLDDDVVMDDISSNRKTDKKEKKAKSKEKKDKKKSKKSSCSDDDVKATANTSSGNAENWNVTELDGGSTRQSKFLRLLGAKKQGVNLSAPAATNDKLSSVRAEADIQRQFEAGMKMKNEGGSHRRGLGLGP